jgi:Lsr2
MREEDKVAQRIQSTLVSDLNGDKATGTVRFALDGTEYEIDLTDAQAGELRSTLGRYAEKARKIRVQRDRAGRPSRDDLPNIRDWARARGHDIKDRGRVPKQIIAEYDALRSGRAVS